MKTLLVLLTATLLVGCNEKIDIEDGEIPAEYLESAGPYLGTYQGVYQQESASMVISLEGRMPKVEFENSTSLLPNECPYQIGSLKYVTLRKKGSLKSAVFELIHDCRVKGRELELNFSKNTKRVKVYILEKWEEVCGPTGLDHDACVSAPTYLSGKLEMVGSL
jgi:hypothetical protein